jgi:hypothetical protein
VIPSVWGKQREVSGTTALGFDAGEIFVISASLVLLREMLDCSLVLGWNGSGVVLRAACIRATAMASSM